MKFIVALLFCALVSAENPELIAFITTQTGHTEVAIVPADGSSEPKILTNLRSDTSHPRLSDDREKIVFSTDYQSEHHSLWVVSTHGGNPQPLADYEDGIEIAGDWSPDQGDLLVLEVVDKETGYTRLHLTDSDGKANYPLMENKEGKYNDFFARWSPTGEELIFLSDRYGHHPEFYAYDLGEDRVQKLGHLPPIVHFPFANGPSFQHDGLSFVYEEERDPNFVSLVQADLSDGNIRELFHVDVVITDSHRLNDLSLSQCVSSPTSKDLFCCRHLTANGGSVLAIVNQDGAIQKTLGLEEVGVFAASPSWK